MGILTDITISKHSQPTELHNIQLTLRVIHILIGCTIMFHMFNYAVYIFTRDTILFRIATLSRSPELVALVFVLLAFLTVPYLLMQMFGLCGETMRAITRLACFSILAAGMQWVFLGWLSRNLDYDIITGELFRMGICTIIYSLILAHGLNSEDVEIR